mmetsp:Transcript_14382/g.43746  ORF Transcript_14382/g.43746 Transcript_14382/m.43746 type:complete len:347 (-) Transcript_14382:557-1597(-)
MRAAILVEGREPVTHPRAIDDVVEWLHERGSEDGSGAIIRAVEDPLPLHHVCCQRRRRRGRRRRRRRRGRAEITRGWGIAWCALCEPGLARAQPASARSAQAAHRQQVRRAAPRRGGRVHACAASPEPASAPRERDCGAGWGGWGRWRVSGSLRLLTRGGARRSAAESAHHSRPRQRQRRRPPARGRRARRALWRSGVSAGRGDLCHPSSPRPAKNSPGHRRCSRRHPGRRWAAGCMRQRPVLHAAGGGARRLCARAGSRRPVCGQGGRQPYAQAPALCPKRGCGHSSAPGLLWRADSKRRSGGGGHRRRQQLRRRDVRALLATLAATAAQCHVHGRGAGARVGNA